jgi:hypothetical protein
MIPNKKSEARVGAVLAVVVVISILSCTVPALSTPPPAGESTLYPTDYVWRDMEGNPLPFQDHASILEFLRTAPIVSSKLMDRGVAGNIKLVLERDDIRIRAVLRVIEREEKQDTGSPRIDLKIRDSQIFEVAAYKLDRLLGIGRIPPTVERTYQGKPGSVQIWMEGVTPEDILLAEGRLIPPDKESWWRQKKVMWVFDALIANTDRNQGNLLIDDDWNLWLIDHTRGFREISTLLNIQDLKNCERLLWDALLTVDRDAMAKLMEPYLTKREISKLLLRHKKLIGHFQKRIKKKGEARVLYDLEPPSSR